MTSIEFAYWLQGAFEIAQVSSFNEEQTQVIKNHLAMVEYTEKNQMSKFCTWLQGFFDMAEPKILSVDQAEKIEEKLAACFTHVVDLSVPERIPTSVPSPRFEAMC